MGRNLDDFFDSIMTHRFQVLSKKPGSEGFVVNSKGAADFNPSDATKAELRQDHAQGKHNYDAGYNPLDVQFSKRYCPDCQAGS